MVVRGWKNHRKIVYNVFRLITESHGFISIACVDMESNDKGQHWVVAVVMLPVGCLFDFYDLTEGYSQASESHRTRTYVCIKTSETFRNF
jgi:hypothetical protein